MFKERDLVMLPINGLNGNKRLFGRLGGHFKPQHLCILSDEKIKNGDWFIRLFDNTLTKANVNSDHKHYECKKVIATTALLTSNINLPVGSFNYLPQPSQSFREHFMTEYNKGNVITKVMIEYVRNEEEQYKYQDILLNHGVEEFAVKMVGASVLKISPDNTINILF